MGWQRLKHVLSSHTNSSYKASMAKQKLSVWKMRIQNLVKDLILLQNGINYYFNYVW